MTSYIDDYWLESGRVVLVVEDHQIVREGMRKVIGIVLSGATFEVLEASTLTEARQIIKARKGLLDLVLLDVNLPDAGGADEVECLKAEWAALPVVVVSACEDWGMASEFLKAGALGFIPKSSNISVMINALRLIFAGGAISRRRYSTCWPKLMWSGRRSSSARLRWRCQKIRFRWLSFRRG